jgi:acyl dehydratase
VAQNSTVRADTLETIAIGGALLSAMLMIHDRQWIHVDPARAADGPFGGTIAHGLLTLSLMPRFMQQMYRVDNIAMGINYGYNKVRFITPVCVGARVRARAVIDTITKLDGTVQAVVTTTVEVRYIP